MTQSKEEKIAKVQANLPLPEQPPRPSDWQSADGRNVGDGSGRVEGHVGTEVRSEAGLRSPATKGDDLDLSSVGRQGKEGLDHPPRDAAYRR
ncbi:hypothetical protein B0I35DRAFT_422111 [Stachybotrys elegans]|uniref:Uncharacterized protein n=1 Tax=Stachybotrys elegans TaxID=80388 RepID=A0A8K0T0G8_9HYPO|nr:hypothetical protein B0I35DRAFT_422111 [Stachybotrys elegans]